MSGKVIGQVQERAHPAHWTTWFTQARDRDTLPRFDCQDPRGLTQGTSIHYAEVVRRLVLGWKGVRRTPFLGEPEPNVDHMEALLVGGEEPLRVVCQLVGQGVVDRMVDQGVLVWTNHHHRSYRLSKNIKDPDLAAGVKVITTQMLLEGTQGH